MPEWPLSGGESFRCPFYQQLRLWRRRLNRDNRSVKLSTKSTTNGHVDLKLVQLSYAEIIADYRIAFRSRQASILGRKEVMGGKAKFGIFGDGKEVAQLALAKAFKKGDFRSGYYRDQTFAFATGISTNISHLHIDYLNNDLPVILSTKCNTCLFLPRSTKCEESPPLLEDSSRLV